uniref:helix-turn-helix transcriptional regulator n=1 Tax=Photorhabdus sp. RM322S TaxID=3342825 RepID=UPI0036DA4898
MAEATLICLADVMKKVGLKKSWIDHLMQQGDFPKPVRRGIQPEEWVEKKIDEWIINKTSSRKKAQG